MPTITPYPRPRPEVMPTGDWIDIYDGSTKPVTLKPRAEIILCTGIPEPDERGLVSRAGLFTILEHCAHCWREDLHAILINPFILGSETLTYAEYTARVTTCPHCGDQCSRESLALATVPEGVTLPPGVTMPTEPICESCRNNLFTECTSCGVRMIRNPNGRNNSQCPACARFRIHGSKLKPVPFFFKRADDDADQRFTGAEIELEFREGYDTNRIVRPLLEPLPQQLMHAEMDGSLRNGIEFVTMPLSAQYIQHNRNLFTDFYDRALSNGASEEITRRNAGLHVHMSRSVISPEQAVAMEKLVTKEGKMQRYLLHLTKRTPDRFNQWARTEASNNVVEGLRAGLPYPSTQRYRFLNWQEKTVECRGFAGDTNVEQFFVASEFVRALHDYVQTPKYPGTLAGFRRFLRTSPYEYLLRRDAAFVDERDKSPDTGVYFPGIITHRGRRTCFVSSADCNDNRYIESIRSAGVTPRGSSDYTSEFYNRLQAAHLPSRLNWSGLRIEFDTSMNAASVDGTTISTSRTFDTALEVMRTALARSVSPVFVGAYCFSIVERAITLGLGRIPEPADDSEDDPYIDNMSDEECESADA